MTHSSQAGLASFAGHTITPADLMAAKAAAWDEGYGTGWVDGQQNAYALTEMPVVNPYTER